MIPIINWENCLWMFSRRAFLFSLIWFKFYFIWTRESHDLSRFWSFKTTKYFFTIFNFSSRYWSHLFKYFALTLLFYCSIYSLFAFTKSVRSMRKTPFKLLGDSLLESASFTVTIGGWDKNGPRDVVTYRFFISLEPDLDLESLYLNADSFLISMELPLEPDLDGDIELLLLTTSKSFC